MTRKDGNITFVDFEPCDAEQWTNSSFNATQMTNEQMAKENYICPTNMMYKQPPEIVRNGTNLKSENESVQANSSQSTTKYY